MTGLTRVLRVDLSAFERHVSNLISREAHYGRAASDLWADVRADAYGHGAELIAPVLRRVGIQNFIDDSVVVTGDVVPRILNADDMYGLAEGGTGFTTFVGEVVNVKYVGAGRRVSYGYTYETTRETTLALVALGYADGVARRASNVCDVAIASARGEIVGRIAGRIAMDQFVVDLGGEHDVTIGTEAILWSSTKVPEQSIAGWSTLTGIPSLALTSHVGYRVEREVRT